MKEKMKLLVGYDGSAYADAALDDLSRAGLPAEDVEAVVLSVAEVWLPPPPPSAAEVVEAADRESPPAASQKWHAKNSEMVKKAEDAASRAAARLRGMFPAWEVTAEAVYGSPAWELVMRADAWRPDLVVVGSQGRTALGRFILGSVSQKVLTEARTSVRVARGRVEVEPSPVRVVVGFDGSDGALRAAREVSRRVWPPGGEARVVIVVDPLAPFAQWVDETGDGERAWRRGLAEAASRELRDSGLSVTPVVLEGDPKRVIVEEAEGFGADSIFVGSTGFGNRMERFLLGSVSAAVAARAHCSVEVVRDAQGPKDD
ncbi:MAG TPA: universal stress protein [Pyrinomonadaceae bacterium]|nr:universal stress protein [Pyrinomonadaceae bacterium]